MTSKRAITTAVRRMLEDAGMWRTFCLRIKNRRAWRFSDDEAVRRCRQMFNGDARYMGIDELVVAFELCGGLDYVTPILQREALRAEDAAATGKPIRRGRAA